MACGGVIALGVFLPWLSLTAPFLGSISRNGTEVGGVADAPLPGVILLLLGGALFVMGLLERQGKASTSWPLAAAVGAGVVIVIGLVNANDAVGMIRGDTDLAAASIGIGGWVSLLGAVVGLITSVRSWTLEVRVRSAS